MGLIQEIAAYKATVDVRILDKTAEDSITLEDESNCFKDLADLLQQFLPDQIISGLGLSLLSSTVTAQPGSWQIGGVIYNSTTPVTLPIDSRDASLDRYDVVYIDASGGVNLVSGVLSATPVEPRIPNNTIKLGSILITPTGETLIPPPATGFVDLTNNQSVDGVKTFIKSPQVPAGVGPNGAVNVSQLTTTLGNYVPYTGATANVDIASFTLRTHSVITFNGDGTNVGYTSNGIVDLTTGHTFISYGPGTLKLFSPYTEIYGPQITTGTPIVTAHFGSPADDQYNWLRYRLKIGGSIGNSTFADNEVLQINGDATASGNILANTDGVNGSGIAIGNTNTGDFMRFSNYYFGYVSADLSRVKYTSLQFANPTAGNAITIPNASGTIILNNGLSSNVILGDGTYASYANPSLFVPYTGASGNVDLNGHNISSSGATFQVNPLSGTYPLYGFNSFDGFYARKTADLYTGFVGDKFILSQNQSTTPSFVYLVSATQTAGNSNTITLPVATGTILLNNGLSSNVILGDGTYAPYANPSGFVPYTGATANVNLGARNLAGNAFNFNGGLINGDSSGFGLVINATTDALQVITGVSDFTPRVIFRNRTDISGSNAYLIFSNSAISSTGAWNQTYTSDNGGDLVFSKHDFSSGNGSIGFTANGNIYDQNGTFFLKANGSSSNVILGDGSYAAYANPSLFVPYTGATGAVNLGSNSLTAGGATLNGQLLTATNLGAASLAGLYGTNSFGKTLLGQNRSGSMAETDFISVAGTDPFAKGGFHFSVLSTAGAETMLLDINGDTLASTFGGIIIPGSVASYGSMGTTYLTLDASTGAIVKRPVSDFSSGGGTYSFANGLTNDGSGNITLGGPLNQTTVIDLSGNILEIIDSSGENGAILLSSTLAEFAYNNGSNNAGLNFNNTTGTFQIFLADNISNRGITNAGDYESNFVARSLVTKQYVDALVSGSGGGSVVNVSSTTGDIVVTSPTVSPSLTLTTVNGINLAYFDPTSSIQTQLNAKQATLVSGTNIKTINSATLLGSSNILLQTPLTAGTDYQVPITLTTTGTSGAATFSGGTLNIPQYSGGGSTPSIGSTLTSATAGSVLFAGSAIFAQDNANFFYDSTNHRLGIGNATPSYSLDVSGIIRSTTKILLGTGAVSHGDYTIDTRRSDTTTINGIYFGTGSGSDAAIKQNTGTSDMTFWAEDFGDVLYVTQGGTIQIPGLGAYQVVLTDGASNLVSAGSGTSGYVFTSNGSGALPTWQPSSGGGGGGTWGSITGTLSSQTDLNTALGLKAPLASPALTGTPTAPTAPTATNTTQVATTAYVEQELVASTIVFDTPFSGTGTTLDPIVIVAATTSASGYLTSTDWNTFNGKQGTITLTTTGTSGAATFSGGTLNIPQYVAGTGTVTSVSVVTANGISGSVATSTTTPAITLTLGAITPTSTNGVSAATMAFLDATSSVQTQLNAKQATLVSGTNIKTINSTTLLGSANILLQTPLVAGTDYQVPITLTTTGSSGAATFSAGTLNIPQYVAGTGTVTSVSVTTANGISGSVATSTTTPAITLTLGAITPTSTNGVSAATMAFLDATSSVQTQLNAKQATLVSATNIKTINSTTLLGSSNILLQTPLVAGTDYQVPITLTTTGSSGAATFSAGTLNIPQYTGGGASPSIGGTLTSATLGSVLFAGSAVFAQDNANLFYDSTNHRLGIGTNTLTHSIDISDPSSASVYMTKTGSLAGTWGMYNDGNGHFVGDALGGGIIIFSAPTSINFRGSANGTDNVIFTAAGLVQIAGLTASQAVFTDASSNLVSVAVTGTGSAVRATTPTLTTPVLGVATATSINKVTITAPTTSATFTLVTGSSLITAGAFALTLTSTATTNATFPTGSGTLTYLAGTNTWSNLQTFGNGISVSLAKPIGIVEGTGGRLGQATLVAGTIAITITGLTTSSRAFPGFVAQAGTSTGVYQYEMVCTANTLTITAVTVLGAIVATDTSKINYVIFN